MSWSGDNLLAVQEYVKEKAESQLRDASMFSTAVDQITSMYMGKASILEDIGKNKQ